jgi:putative aldouronate transport system permease protein
MYGVQLAFKNFRAVDGIWGSPWIGFEQFLRFFRSANFWNLIKNTLSISIYSLAVGFPLPVLLALMLNEVRHRRFKKTVQMVTYAPHFISTVVIVGMMNIFLTPGTGIVNKFFDVLGLEYIPFLSKPEWFQTLYVFSGVWQNCGWNSIIYMSVLSSVDIQLYEAARVDGATKLQKMVHIDLPSIVPTMAILLILNMGGLMNVGFEKVFLMQNPLNMRTGDVISTYVYRVGLIDGDFSFSTAVGLFNSVINFILLVSVNTISKKLGNNSLW